MKYNISSVYPTTQMVMGQQTADQRIEQIADDLYNNFMCGHRVELRDIAELARIGEERARQKFLDKKTSF